ncbi:MAG: preprotein translocase subunit SecG [Candidatus Levybacteria bacterium]|nr:preprotein translocase subunit SecG [Candidatus Levybacteria bacterium]
MMLYILQIIVAALLVGAILLQAQGGGLSPVFGGGGEMYRSRQNVEKFLIAATVVLALLLSILSIALLFPQQ